MQPSAAGSTCVSYQGWPPAAPTFRQSSIDETPDLSDQAHEGSFSMDETCNRGERGATIEEFGLKVFAADRDPAQPGILGADRDFNVNENAMRKFETLTVMIAGILLAASIANAIIFPIPLGPVRACPFGAIWAVIWK